MTGNFGANINGNLLPADRINPDLPAEEKQVLVPEQEIKDVGVLEKKSSLLGNLNWIRGEVELLLVNIGIGKIGVHCGKSDQIARQAVFDVHTTAVQGTPRLAGKALGPQEPVRLDNQQASALGSFQPLKRSSLRHAPEAKNPVVARPFVLFVLAANEATEIYAPGHVGAATEVQGAERDFNRSGPAAIGDFCRRVPQPVPAGIHNGVVLRRRPLLDDLAVTLRSEGIHLEDVPVAMT